MEKSFAIRKTAGYRLAVLLFCILAAASAWSQSLEGIVTDADNGQPIRAVIIDNRSSNNSTFTNVDGYYYIDAKANDTIRFYTLGYETFDLVVKEQEISGKKDIVLLAQKFAIDEIIIGKELSKYQLDSIERREIYGKKVDYKGAEVKVDIMPMGFVMEGAITRLAEKASRKYRRLKKFQKRYKETETELYAHSRYSDELVSSLTQLSDTALQEFKWRYPIDPDFGKNATDVELELWIMHNFKKENDSRN